MSLSRRTLVLVNPISGAGQAVRIQPLVADYFREHGFSADFAVTDSAENICQRAHSASRQGYECVAALGGDGTFHHVLAGAFGTFVPLALIPAGGGNDIARALGIPPDPLRAAQAIMKCSPRPVDVLCVTFADGRSRIYIGAGGLGVDAEAAHLARSHFRRLPGAARYVAAALWTLRTFEPLSVSAVLDDKQLEYPLLCAAVANARSYGSGLIIAPRAEMDDGLMDLTLVGDLPWVRIFEAFFVLLRNGDLRWPEVRRFRARCARLTASRTVRFHGDGETLGEVGPDAPVEVKVLPAAISVVAPPIVRNRFL
jgi:diacylglycerol kinase (ATP)